MIFRKARRAKLIRFTLMHNGPSTSLNAKRVFHRITITIMYTKIKIFIIFSTNLLNLITNIVKTWPSFSLPKCLAIDNSIPVYHKANKQAYDFETPENHIVPKRVGTLSTIWGDKGSKVCVTYPFYEFVIILPTRI